MIITLTKYIPDKEKIKFDSHLVLFESGKKRYQSTCSGPCGWTG